MTPKVIDLSHHNTIPSSLQPARDSGILGVIHKCTEGLTFVDSKCSARRHLAEEAGMLWGVYHFLRPGNIPEQVAFFLDSSRGIFDGQTLFAADHEDLGVSLDDLVQFMHGVEEGTGRSPILYSGHVLKEQLRGYKNHELSNYRLWLAQYGSSAELPPGWNKYWLWQYTDRGQVPGIDPPTDLNQFDGSDDDLAVEWAGGGGAPIPSPGPIKITLEITAISEVPVEITIVQK